MGSHLIAVLTIVGLSLVGVVGDFFIKLSGNGPKYVDLKWLILGFVVYSSTAIGWFFAMKHVKLSNLGLIYGVTTVIALVLVSVFYFKETLNVYEIVGLAAGLSALVLLGR